MTRPRIAIPGRFTASASALRYQGVVTARRLADAIWRAGGDPITILPATGSDAHAWSDRLDGIAGVLLPGGGDVNPERYGRSADDPSLYDVDDLQDESDLSLAAFALDSALPLLAICRGLHVVNTLRGGTLVTDMPVRHRHHIHRVQVTVPSPDLGLPQDALTSSCYHHQCIDDLGADLTAVAYADDGTIEAVAITSPGWALGVQWHPEDTYDTDPNQQAIFAALITAARTHA